MTNPHQSADDARLAFRRARAALVWITLHPRFVSWVVACVGMNVLLAATKPVWFGPDADLYWTIALSADHPFAILDFSHDIRGFSIPMLLRFWATIVAPAVGDPFGAQAAVTVRLLMVFLAATLTCVLAPGIARQVCNTARVTVPRLLLLSGLFFLCWHGDLLQPMSDIPSLGAFAAAVLLLLRPPAGGWWTTLLAGALLGFTINARPAYYLATVAAVGALFLLERRLRPTLLKTGVCVAGIAIVLIPQLMINIRDYQHFTVQPVRAGNLNSFFMRGLKLERYDTRYPEGGQPRGVIRSVSRTFEEELESRREFESIGEYLEFVVRRPVAASAMYGRHIINGLDTRFGGTYVEAGEVASPLLVALNFLVISLGVVFAALRWRDRRSAQRANRVAGERSPTTYFLLVLAATLFPAVLGAMEIRFLIALHLSALTACVLGARLVDLPKSTLGLAAAGTIVVASVALMFVVTEATIARLE